ncbi:NADH-dependent flavin oxidoreductase [Kingella negevensis]|uniref:NADH-dependent flavin oxidoreductase n=1 Tax=Kingella negevensis TaxID=1522312 RepID=UPI00254F341B|nr:NADH-dependent flavin oxidoreductase [Kingella negevensis]MDK4680807.1 NADH-dependent flavin oxidoreductase [Kingella negevensis]MDK4681470.1 NADH-dependent flavin oxidoreductase [Kingella negevensis]MDK4691857.1 NADH-dependent flavin oxidoreductase [Kingella negevensis]MDK4692990.1 NADH-dependent flavin oxidoreductase [Kingella negevensis]MDK4699289.1 NADH-dependent flavin oxidoreductase [Kingella negevensis]
MKTDFSRLYQPIKFNNGVEIKNRLVVAPMTHCASDENGHITDEERNYLRDRFNGFGMFISACVLVHPSGKAFHGQPEAIGVEDLPSLSEVAQIAKAQGTTAILQIHHGGHQSIPALNNGEIVAPSAMNGARELTDSEIREIIAGFANAADLAVQAGYDGVEIHGANGYLIQQFYSAESNQRTDEWGGSRENRMKFPLAVVDAVTAAVAKHNRPDFIIGYRFSPEEPGENGLTMTDTYALIDALLEKPLQYLHVSLHNFYNHARRGADETKTRMELLHAHINGRLPFIGVGNLITPKQIADAFDTGWADMVALGKTVLLNPDLLDLVNSGREDEVHTEIDPAQKDRYRYGEFLWNINMQGPNGFLPELKK